MFGWSAFSSHLWHCLDKLLQCLQIYFQASPAFSSTWIEQVSGFRGGRSMCESDVSCALKRERILVLSSRNILGYPSTKHPWMESPGPSVYSRNRPASFCQMMFLKLNWSNPRSELCPHRLVQEAPGMMGAPDVSPLCNWLNLNPLTP